MGDAADVAKANMLAWMQDALPKRLALALTHPACDRMSVCATAARELLVHLRSRTSERALLASVLNHEGLLDRKPPLSTLALLTVREAMSKLISEQTCTKPAEYAWSMDALRAQSA